MIGSIITVLLLLLLFVVAIQPNKTRLAVALVFVGVTWSHELLLSDLEGLMSEALVYHGTAALWALGIIIIISNIRPITETALTIQKICLSSIYLNAIGWLMWFMDDSRIEHNPVVYEVGFVVLYAWALLALSKGTSIDVGADSDNRRMSDFRGDLYSRAGFIFRHKGQA